MHRPTESFVYQIDFSDGSEFEIELSNISDLKNTHKTITALTLHMEKTVSNLI